MRSGHLGVLILAGIVSACGSSPPTHFYTLSTQPAPAPADPAGYPMRTVALGEVKLPDALDRPQIARQIGPNQLEYAEADRWAGPLDDMMRRVLAADLRPLLPAGTALDRQRFVEPGRNYRCGRCVALRRRQSRSGDARCQLGNPRQERARSSAPHARRKSSSPVRVPIPLRLRRR